MGTDLVAVIVVCPKEPLTVPAVLLHGFLHGFYSLFHAGGGAVPYFFQQFRKVAAFGHKQACNHQGFGLGAFGLVLRGLERLVGIVGETVQIQAVVPVGPADERKPVRTQIICHVLEAYLQMVQHRHLCSRLIIKGNLFIQ